MHRDDVLRLLDAHRAEAERRFGVQSLALFGSLARDEAREGSDVDVLVEFRGPPTFDSHMGLLEFLEERLGATVDMVSTTGLRLRLHPYVEKDLIRVA